MDLIPTGSLSVRINSRWPNTIVFPKELRDAIPEYGPRALVFDAVSETHLYGPVAIPGINDGTLFNTGPRAQIQLVVHETGKLDGKYTLLADLDAETTRALGQFLIEVADRTEARRHGGG